MFDLDFTRAALSTLGAIVLTATSVGAAIGPARMVETTPIVYAEAAPQVEDVANA